MLSTQAIYTVEIHSTDQLFYEDCKTFQAQYLKTAQNKDGTSSKGTRHQE